LIKASIIEGKLTFTECNIAFDKTVDLLVCGMGTGGVLCALSAAKRGISVLGFDRMQDVGGMNTAGLVSYYYYGYMGGMYEQLDSLAYESRDKFIMGYQQSESTEATAYNALMQNGVELLLNTVALSLYLEGNRVVGAELFSGNKAVNVKSTLTVDATSDGHIIRMTGVKTFFGRSADGTAAPFSSMSRYIDRQGKHKHSTSDCGLINPFDASAFTKSVLASRVERKTPDALLSLGMGELPGIREGLRFEGEETVTLHDVVFGRSYDKTLMFAYSDIDKHGIDTAVDTEEFQNYFVLANMSTVAFRIPVPFGAVIPKSIKGIASSCRCLSIDAYASSGVRMIRDMKRLGECMGIAASLAIKNGCDISEIDYAEYCVLAEKARLGDEKCVVGFDNILDHKKYKPIKADKTFEEIDSELNSQTPAGAMYSCILNKSRYEEHLLELFTASNGCQHENCAIILGIFGRKEVLPTLRNMIENRSCKYFTDCRRSNQFPSVDAICLLGRLGEREDIKLLEQIVFDEKEYSRELYHTLKPDYLFCSSNFVNYVYYLHFTHSIIALIKLCNKYDVKIKDRVTELFSGNSREKTFARVCTENIDLPFVKSFERFIDFAISFAQK